MQDSLVNYLIPKLAIASLEFLLVGFLVAALLAIRPGTSPLWRRRIWLLAMLKPFATVLTGFLPGFIHLPTFLTAGNFLGDLLSHPGVDEGLLVEGGSGAVFLKIVAYGWLVGTAAMLFVLWRRATVSNQLIEEAQSRGYQLKPASIKVLDPNLEISENARVIITPDECGPATLGAWRSVVVIPETLLPWVNEHRDPTQLERDRFLQVLRHELSHLSRRDDRATMFAAITVAFFWFHPVAHWAYSRVRINNELCCDMQVVESGVIPSDYVNTLMNVVSGQFARKGFSMSIMGDASSAGLLRRRLHFLLSDEVQSSTRNRSAWGYFVILLILCAMPRLIAPTLATVEVLNSSGQVVRVTMEEFESNPDLKIIDPSYIQSAARALAVAPDAITPSQSATESVGQGGGLNGGGMAMGKVEFNGPQNPESAGADGPSGSGQAPPASGELLANVSEEDAEPENDAEVSPKEPKKKSRGRGWAGGGLGEPARPDAPILPPRTSN